MPEQDLPQPFELDVTCATKTCGNYKATIRVLAYSGGNVWCGPCGSIIAKNVSEPSA